MCFLLLFGYCFIDRMWALLAIVMYLKGLLFVVCSLFDSFVDDLVYQLNWIKMYCKTNKRTKGYHSQSMPFIPSNNFHVVVFFQVRFNYCVRRLIAPNCSNCTQKDTSKYTQVHNIVLNKTLTTKQKKCILCYFVGKTMSFLFKILYLFLNIHIFCPIHISIMLLCIPMVFFRL